MNFKILQKNGKNFKKMEGIFFKTKRLSNNLKRNKREN